MGPPLLLLNYWPLMDSGEGGVIIFTCVPTTEPTRLQQISPTSGHSLNSVDHKANRHESEKDL